ncbi:Crp/Fnr family transcriptional regulator [Listeria booriae]|uniref:Crp/Fnr family transcriptional regulator n=1 Tax=Listeria booriae TaxID=1552123 RepID=A0A7X1D6K3_9LIST|nr:Crp/Fnr family transcriptional regulator [Listeria booriae]MBC2167930.1 Crp/Fnr family transcriptional regulator [Listeria booriae]
MPELLSYLMEKMNDANSDDWQEVEKLNTAFFEILQSAGDEKAIEYVEVKPGEVLSSIQGQQIYYLVQGSFMELIENAKGKPTYYVQKRPLHTFYGAGLIRPRTVFHLNSTLKAMENSAVYKIDPYFFKEYLDKNLFFYAIYGLQHTNAMELAEAQIIHLSQSKEERVRLLIEHLSENFGTPTSEGLALPEIVTPSFIARNTGSTRAYTSTLIKKYEAEQKIKTIDRQLYVCTKKEATD